MGCGLAAGLWVAVAHSGSAGVHAVSNAGADHQRPQKPGAVRQGGPFLILQQPSHPASSASHCLAAVQLILHC